MVGEAKAMARITPYLDIRRKKADGTCLLKLAVYASKRTRYISLDILLKPEHWDDVTKTVNKSHPNQAKLNMILSRKVFMAESVLLKYSVQDIEPSVEEAVDDIREIFGMPKTEKEDKSKKETIGTRFLESQCRHPESSPRPTVSNKALETILSVGLDK